MVIHTFIHFFKVDTKGDVGREETEQKGGRGGVKKLDTRNSWSVNDE